MIEQKVHRIKNAEEDTEGLDAVITVENRKIMIDFTKPIQFLELDDTDAHRMIASLVMAGVSAFGEKGEPIKFN